MKNFMRCIITAISVSIVTLLPTISISWELTTPLGITIKASNQVVQQYNEHWYICEPSIPFPLRPHPLPNLWNRIEWDKVDEMFLLLQEQYQSYPDPTRLKIVIRKLDYRCVDEETIPGFEMVGCIDGYYPSSNTLWIHLGDDSGQGSGAFEGTALSHELQHYFLYHKGDPHWRDE